MVHIRSWTISRQISGHVQEYQDPVLISFLALYAVARE